MWHRVVASLTNRGPAWSAGPAGPRRKGRSAAELRRYLREVSRSVRPVGAVRRCESQFRTGPSRLRPRRSTGRGKPAHPRAQASLRLGRRSERRILVRDSSGRCSLSALSFSLSRLERRRRMTRSSSSALSPNTTRPRRISEKYRVSLQSCAMRRWLARLGSSQKSHQGRLTSSVFRISVSPSFLRRGQ